MSVTSRHCSYIHRLKVKINDRVWSRRLCPSPLTLLALSTLVVVIFHSKAAVLDNLFSETPMIKRVLGTHAFPHVDRPLAIIFTTFSERADKLPIYTNTIKNWAAFLPHVQPVLYSTFPSGPVLSVAREHGWYVHPCPEVNAFGSPVLRAMYLKSYELFNASLYGYANGDILFDWGLNDTLGKVSEHLQELGVPLLFGIRSNYNVNEQRDDDEEPLWPPGRVHQLANSNLSALFRPQFGDAQDYFFVSRGFPFEETAAVVVSREGFDTYLLSLAGVKRLATIDGTASVSALHMTDKDGNMAHQAVRNTSDALYNRIMVGKNFKYPLGRAAHALHKTKRRDMKVVITCNQRRRFKTGPCKADNNLVY